ncbi:MAG: penicillin-binding protein 2 [Candidatus Sungbacteria bacterium RIFCSPLOWO2_02_FULL_51_17]|uniref:Penicillin-binding protein 2 n=1 Tax=Candidatus Sungbacteria bacterium RIFCSPHIGHO2_02_FULL_51_29 TaxID=1802273 RepID=A0A1G2KWA0_9BACT|nr:MAG: penicillin-binding protein 2 [Candidatus Sungbacteria bacterium RIFCSPHIGHO2_02_FULL_51_29]OHA11299.1 MAG: penicillin-binding protein 2 [Candidatus Sungbacteria bacterium RIFCSPLOWO2_02_FULL_51_17]
MMFKRKKVLHSSIDPDEIFADAANISDFARERGEGSMELSIGARPFSLFVGVVIVVLIVIAARLAVLQISEGATYAARARENQYYSILSAAPRGIMYDVHGIPLVSNDPAFSLVIQKKALADTAAKERLVKELAALSVVFEEGWDEGGGEDSVSIRTIDRAAAREIIANPDRFPGAEVEERYVRVYAYPEAFAHVLGYVGKISQKERKEHPDYALNDGIGKDGVEAYYEDLLRGVHGEKVIQVNAMGTVEREHYFKPAESGANLLLNIDADLQKKAYSVFRAHLAASGKRAGSVVISDPRTGAIRALVSIPTYDANLFQRPLTQKDVERLFQNPLFPFFNRAISASYPPGSTIKPLEAAAVVDEKILDPRHQIYDEGFIEIPNPYRPGESAIFRDWKALGWVDLRRAIALSANVYFYTVGGGYKDVKGLGIERLKKYAGLFGWGAILGIDLHGEAAGIFPDPAWKEKNRPDDPVWRVGDTYNSSIGQGDVNVTPLQVNMATAAIANYGTLWRPRVVSAVLDENKAVVQEFAPAVIRKDFVSRDALKIVREGMRMAVTEGSAQGLAYLPVTIAGKTGTAQTGTIAKNHGWFTGFAPYEDSELAITVMVEQGTGGSVDAVPVAREILEWYFTPGMRDAREAVGTTTPE